MEIERLTGSHVFDLQTEKYLGKITHPIIDYEGRIILGFVFKKAFYLPRRVFEFAAIEQVLKDFVLIDKAKAKSYYSQRKLRKAFQKQRQVITLKLVEDGKQVGKAFDFIVDDKTGAIKTLLAEKNLFSDIFRIPISKVKGFDVDSYVLEKETVSKKKQQKTGLLSRAISGAARTIGTVAQQGRKYYDQGQRNMLLGQISPCDIYANADEVLLKEGQTIDEEVLEKLDKKDKLGELSAVLIGSGIGTKYRSYGKKKKNKALGQDEQPKKK